MDDLTTVVKAELARISSDADKFMRNQKDRTEALDTKTQELQARLLEAEQKLARRGSEESGGYGAYDGGSAAVRALLEGSEDLKAVANRTARRAVIELPKGYFKAAITSTGITIPDQRPGIVMPAQRRMTIRQLLPSVPTSGGSVQYLQETGFTNAAATVSEGDTKPESNLEFELKTSAIVVLAHWIRISVQALADVPTMQMYLDGRLRYGLAYVEEVQLLRGSGVGNNLSGMMTLATAYSGSASGKIDILRSAITQLQNTDFSASGIILHPTDWESIALLKDTQGRYLVGDPSGPNPPTLWNLPVIPTAAMVQENFLVGDFQQAGLIYDREQARVDISTETDDDFVTNRAHVRAEERLGFGVLRPGALIKGSFGS